MAANSKVNLTFEIQEDQQEWLEDMATNYNLPDSSKALRCILDAAMEEGDFDKIFETIRCRHCG